VLPSVHAHGKEIPLSPSRPGDQNVVCHYGRKTSPHAYTCLDCRREFYLQCIEVQTPTEGQIITCPNCGGENLQRQSKKALLFDQPE
jgi:DNA-directed RNA polymerase subunit RPC12/RpoP